MPDRAFLLRVYETMLRIRALDDAGRRASKRGEIPGVIHLSLGQEATAAGACLAIEPGDVVTSNHRDHGHAVALGSDPGRLLAELMGKATGVCSGNGGSQHLIDTSVGLFYGSAVLGGSVPAAVGAAFAAQHRGEPTVAIAFFGEGSANEGVVHEAMNLAGAWSLPVVFFCEHNGFAVTVPDYAISSTPDIAARAPGYGMPGEIVDGQDALAVFEATRAALDRARRGEGPSLVEAKTYRYSDHGENLLTSPYRSEDDIERWRLRDPIALFERGPLATAGIDEHELAAVRERVDGVIAKAVEFATHSPWPDQDQLYTHLYAEQL